MPAPPRLASIWGYALLDDWAWGLILDQAQFQVLGYAPGSSIDQAGPSTGPVVGDDVDDGSARRFADDAIRNNDSL